MLAALILRFGRDQRAATAIEYGLIAGLVTVAVIASMIALGNSVDSLFNQGAGVAAQVMGNAMGSS